MENCRSVVMLLITHGFRIFSLSFFFLYVFKMVLVRGRGNSHCVTFFVQKLPLTKDLSALASS